MKTILIHLCLLIGISNHTTAFAQKAPFQDKISTHIELPTEPLVLDVPIFFHYVLTNNSDETLYVEVGGDYRGGRKESFKVFVTTSEGDTLTLPKPSAMSGGFSGFKAIAPQESRKFKLFLPKWVKIEEAGDYTIHVSKTFKMSETDPYQVQRQKKKKKSKAKSPQKFKVPQAATKDFSVIADEAKWQASTKELLQRIENQTKGGLIEGQDLVIGEESNRISHALYEDMRLLQAIRSESMVPFLVEIYREELYFSRKTSKKFLIPFAFHKDVLSVIKEVE